MNGLVFEQVQPRLAGINCNCMTRPVGQCNKLAWNAALRGSVLQCTKPLRSFFAQSGQLSGCGLFLLLADVAKCGGCMGLVAQPHQIAMYQLCQVEVGVIADEGAGFFERFGNFVPARPGQKFQSTGFRHFPVAYGAVEAIAKPLLFLWAWSVPLYRKGGAHVG